MFGGGGVAAERLVRAKRFEAMFKVFGRDFDELKTARNAFAGYVESECAQVDVPGVDGRGKFFEGHFASGWQCQELLGDETFELPEGIFFEDALEFGTAGRDAFSEEEVAAGLE